MRSIERRFNKIATDNSFWSSYVCFAEAVKKQNFSKRILLYYFNKLVKKEDYAMEDKKQIIKNLLSLTVEP